jgi:hypothetical protein
MNLNDYPIQPAEPRNQAAPPLEPAINPTGFRRTVLTAGMAAALLIASGVPVVSAASPDPPASPTTVDQADG